MVQNVTQFGLTPEQGMVTMQVPGQVITGLLDSAITNGAVPGQPLKMVNNTTPIPTYTALTANTDKTDAFVPLNPIFGGARPGKPFEAVSDGAIMYMTAGGVIARDGLVEVVYTTNKVIISGGVNPVVGRALDAAAADGDLIRVKITCQTVQIAAT